MEAGNSRIYFSGKPTVSGNTCDASQASNMACNVELSIDSNAVINTKYGGLLGGTYIGIYVPNGENLFTKHGEEGDPFGTFTDRDNTANMYGFVNDRNGLKGGLKQNQDTSTDKKIYWVKIYGLKVSKTVMAGASTTVNPNEPFLFKVNIRGNASVQGQPNAKDIDSGNYPDNPDYYGEMKFTSNKTDTSTAVFALKDGESVTSVNLSDGLDYEIIEYLIVSGGGWNNQHKRYAAVPMNGNSSEPETLTVDGMSYEVIKANTYSSKIGENKDRTDVDPYISAVPFTNLMPVCKITDNSGNLLYRRYTWEKTTNKAGEQEYYFAPAVYTELTGDNGAFKALEGTLYSSNGSNPASFNVNNGVKIQMLISSYIQSETIVLPATVNGTVMLTTASASDTSFPKQDTGTTSTIRRGFSDSSMFTVYGDLVLNNVILDGVKTAYRATTNGGIVNVPDGGKLAIQTGATLQNSKTSESGGAVFVDSGGTVTVTSGTINRNESTGDGAGIYLEQGSRLYLSGNPSFGGAGLDVGGNIDTTKGNWQDTKFTAKTNGGKAYSKPRQDIFIAGYESNEEEATNAESLEITGDIDSGDGTIWVWAEKSPHYATLRQFAKYSDAVSKKAATFAVFRNAGLDDETGADQFGQYLYGTDYIEVEGIAGNVYWSGVKGSRRVILRKTNQTYEPLKGLQFVIHAGSPDGNPVTGIDIGGNETTTFISGDSGVFYIGDLNYGTYYIEEANPKNSFILTVDENGVGNNADQTDPSAYSNQLTATAN